MKHLTALLILTGLVSTAGVARATVPSTLTQQGRLLNSDGTAATGPVMIVFALYAADSGGTALWNETQMVTLDDGYFTVQLGSVTAIPSTTWDGATKFLGITVGSDSEMTPREALTSVPYAITAGHADVADDATGDIHPHSVTVNSVQVIKPDGTLGVPLPTPPQMRSVGVHFTAASTATPYSAVATLTFTPSVDASSLFLQATGRCFGRTSDANVSDVGLLFNAGNLFCILNSYCPSTLAYFSSSTVSTAGALTLTSVVNQTFTAGTQYSFSVFGFQSANATNLSCDVLFTGILGTTLAP